MLRRRERPGLRNTAGKQKYEVKDGCYSQQQLNLSCWAFEVIKKDAIFKWQKPDEREISCDT